MLSLACTQDKDKTKTTAVISPAISERSIEQVVGVDGGILRLKDQLVVEIPPGALDHDLKIGLADCGHDDNLIAPIYCLSPEGTHFNKAVTVTIRTQTHSGQDLRHAHLAVRRNGQWHRFATSGHNNDRGEIWANTRHFSDYSVTLDSPAWVRAENGRAERAGVILSSLDANEFLLHAHSGMALADVTMLRTGLVEFSGLPANSVWHLAIDSGASEGLLNASASGKISIQINEGRHFLILLSRPGTVPLRDQASCEAIESEDGSGQTKPGLWVPASQTQKARCILTNSGSSFFRGSISLEAPDLELDCQGLRIEPSANAEQIGITLAQGAARSRVTACRIYGFEFGVVFSAQEQIIDDLDVVATYGGITGSGTNVIIRDNQISTLNDGEFGIAAYSAAGGEISRNHVAGLPIVGIDVMAFPENVVYQVLDNQINGTSLSAIRVAAIYPFITGNRTNNEGASLNYDFGAVLRFADPHPEAARYHIQHNNFTAADAAGFKLVASLDYVAAQDLDITLPLEASSADEGNYWGTPGYFVPGVMSNTAFVNDSFPFCHQDGWLVGEDPINCQQLGEPPNVVVEISPNELNCGSVFTIDASDSHDDEDVLAELWFRYEWSDGEISDWSHDPSVEHQFSDVGSHSVVVQVRDSTGQVSSLTQAIEVVPLVPEIYSFDTSRLASEQILTIFGRNFMVPGINAPEISSAAKMRIYLNATQVEYQARSVDGIQMLGPNWMELHMQSYSPGRYGVVIVDGEGQNACGTTSRTAVLDINATDSNIENGTLMVTNVQPRVLTNESSAPNNFVNRVTVTGLNFAYGDTVTIRDVNTNMVRFYILKQDILYTKLPNELMFNYFANSVDPGLYYIGIEDWIPQNINEKNRALFEIAANDKPEFSVNVPNPLLRNEIMITGDLRRGASDVPEHWTGSVHAWIGKTLPNEVRQQTQDPATETATQWVFWPDPNYPESDPTIEQVVPFQFKYRIGLLQQVEIADTIAVSPSLSISEGEHSQVELDQSILVVPIAFHRVRSDDDLTGTEFPNNPDQAQQLVDNLLGMTTKNAFCENRHTIPYRPCSIEEQQTENLLDRYHNGSSVDQILGSFYDYELYVNKKKSSDSTALYNFGHPRCGIIFRYHSLDTVFVSQETAMLTASDDLNRFEYLNQRDTAGAIDVFLHKGFSDGSSGFAPRLCRLGGLCISGRKVVLSDDVTLRTYSSKNRQIIAHEIGHALSLSHPKRSGPYCLPLNPYELFYKSYNFMATAPEGDDDHCQDLGLTELNNTPSERAIAVTPEQCQIMRQNIQECL